MKPGKSPNKETVNASQMFHPNLLAKNHLRLLLPREFLTELLKGWRSSYSRYLSYSSFSFSNLLTEVYTHTLEQRLKDQTSNILQTIINNPNHPLCITP
jgi:hypothetical protein